MPVMALLVHTQSVVPHQCSGTYSATDGHCDTSAECSKSQAASAARHESDVPVLELLVQLQCVMSQMTYVAPWEHAVQLTASKYDAECEVATMCVAQPVWVMSLKAPLLQMRIRMTQMARVYQLKHVVLLMAILMQTQLVMPPRGPS